MTYYCGIALGVGDRDPHIQCDKCGLKRGVMRRSGLPSPYAWFMGGKSAPGWKLVRDIDGDQMFRSDYCPKCKDGAK